MKCIVIVTVVLGSMLYETEAAFVRSKRGVSEHHHGATSYQNVHIDNFHPVPVYSKHGHHEEASNKHRIGSVEHNVHVSHGHGKHDPGHATVSGNIEGHGHEGNHENLAIGGGLGEYHHHEFGSDEALSGEQGLGEYGHGGDTSSHYELEGHQGHEASQEYEGGSEGYEGYGGHEGYSH